MFIKCLFSSLPVKYSTSVIFEIATRDFQLSKFKCLNEFKCINAKSKFNVTGLTEVFSAGILRRCLHARIISRR